MRRYLLAALVVLALSRVVQSQTGLPPFGSLDRVGLETRNNQDLNILLAIPIMSSPGRGGLNLDFSVVYNSSIWTRFGTAWIPNSSLVPPWGWATSYSTGQTTSQSHTTQRECADTGGHIIYIDTTQENNYEYTDPVGTVHSFPTVYAQQVTNYCTGGTTYSGTLTGYASDGSGYYISISEYTGSINSLLSRSGFSVGSGEITDPNGNYISSTTNGNETDWTDSRGQLALKVITNGTTSIQYKFLDPTGAYQTTTLNLESLSIKTDFGCSGVVEYTGTASVPSSIVLPNNQTYTFTYESYQAGGNTYYTGRLQEVKLPTGGYYQYTYTGSNDGIDCSDGTTLSMTRTVSDGTNSAPWNYVRNTSALTTTITTPKLADTPNANDLVVTFNSSGQEVSRKIYANSPGSGTPLRTINTTWASNGTPSTQITILDDGSTQSKVGTTYGSNGLLDSVSEYNFGSGGPGALFRTTNYTYNTSTNYTSLNLIELVISKQIEDGTGTTQYRQDMTYDASSGDNQECPSGIPQHNDIAYGCSFLYRGNPTSVTTYLTPATQGNPITKNFTYDWFGNLLTAQVNCCQTKTWVYSSATQYSEPDSVTSGTSPSLKTQATYNSSTGQLLTFTDPNGLVTNFSYDSLRRPMEIWQTINSNNIGGTVSYAYNDTLSTATTTVQVDSSKSVQQIKGVDGLGRPNLSTTEDASSTVYSKVSALYDLAGRSYQISNPYKGTSGSYWTTTNVDVLGRPTSVTLADNSATTYSYAVNSVTITDPVGIKRESIIDAAGRLSNVYEPDPTNGNSLTLQTSYTYTALDDLTQVVQGSQTRAYVYDALGRLTSASTPEVSNGSGQCPIAYTYDSYDNVLTRTVPAPGQTSCATTITTTYTYDGLNRLTGLAYSNTTLMPNVCSTLPNNTSANVCYYYDQANVSPYPLGRRTSMADPSGNGTYYVYDALGRITSVSRGVGSTSYPISYAYNLANELTQITYPSDRIVQQSVDPIGRLCEIAPTTTACGSSSAPYATGFGYSAAGQVTGFEYGNKIYASYGFSPDRLQLNCLDYSTTNRGVTCTHDGTTKFGLNYSYGSVGSNNGEISSINDYMDSGRSATYTYDALYRLTKAVTTGSSNYPAWGLSETYDRYGNRTQQAIVNGTCVAPMTCPTNQVSVSATTNQITGSPYLYDARGEMTNDGVNTLSYDGEGRAVAVSGSLGSGAYTYDGNGLRVKKVAGSTTIVYIFSGTKVIAEYQNGAAMNAPTREYIYAGRRLLARIDSTGTKYYHQDHLSNRLVTDTSGNTYTQMGHFPSGESWYNATSDKLYFTTYEWDSESGNHYAMARYHVSRLSRLSTPDPFSGPRITPLPNPQSLNRYTYALNNPINSTDPLGLCGEADQPHYDENGSVDGVQGGTPCDVGGGDSPINQLNGGGPGAGGGAPGAAASGGNAAAALSIQVLRDCLMSLYGVTLASFSPSQLGVNGSFVGFGPDINDNGGLNYDEITVTNDVNTYSLRDLNPGLALSGAVTASTAYTPLDNLYENYHAKDVTLQESISEDQLVELGNSLSVLTGVTTVEAALNRDAEDNPNRMGFGVNNPPGTDLFNCVKSGGPGGPH